MAQTVAVVRNTLPSAAVGNTVDFTKASFGTPTAAIILWCSGNTTSNPQTSAVIGVGFWDGTNQRSVGAYDEHGVAPTNTTKSSEDSRGVVIPAAASNSAEYTVSAITDGIRLTLSVDNTGASRYCTVILLAGVSAKTLTFTPNGTQNATTESASLGFAPQVVFFASIGSTTADVSVAAHAQLSFGFAADDATHRMLAFSSADATGTEEIANILYSETRCVGDILSDAVTWTGEVTTFGSDTFTMTTRDGATGGDVCFALALGGADLSFDCGTLTTPTSTGDSVVSTGVSPDAILLALSTATGTSIETGTGANGLMFGLADDDGEFCHNICQEDGATFTTSSASTAHATQCIDLNTKSGGVTTAMCDATATLNSADFTLSFTATDGTARKGWWVAFGAAGGGGGTNVSLMQISG